MSGRGWIGVDLDGTLARSDHGQRAFGHGYVGAPIPLMVARVQAWLAAGEDVRILTARVNTAEDLATEARLAIGAFCLEHFGRELPVTASKDYGMVALYDDRAVQVVENTGELMPVVWLQLAVVAAGALRGDDHLVWGSTIGTLPCDCADCVRGSSPCDCADCVAVRRVFPSEQAWDVARQHVRSGV